MDATNMKELLSIDEEDIFKVYKTIPNILIEIDKLKKEAVNLLSEEENLDKWYKESTEILEDSNKLLIELNDCNKLVDTEILHELVQSLSEYSNTSQSLLDVESTLTITTHLVECDKRLKSIEELKRVGDIFNAVQALIEFTDYLNNPLSGVKYLILYKVIKSTVVLYWDQVLGDLSVSWKKIINWTEFTENKVKKVYFIVDNADKKHYENILKALDASNRIHDEVKKVSNFILRHLFFPIIHQDTSVIDETENCHKLTLIISLKSKGRPHYENVLNNIKCVLSFISKNLEYKMPSSGSLLRQIGDIISDEFCDVLVKHCLMLTIPTCASELQEYNKITSQVENFQGFLSNINFFSSDNISILQYANNIDVLFAEKTSQYFLEKARNIMKNDLNDTIIVGVEKIPECITDTSVDRNLQEIIIGFEEFMPSSMFYFPNCTVSSSIQELIDLIYVAMEQASQGSDLCANRFYYTARYIIEFYEAVVPKFHETLLETMPKIVALFHNNCMYLAHKLLTLGVLWQTKLEGREYNYTINFVDQVDKLRNLGSRHLLFYMQNHRKQILETIRVSDLSSIGVNDLLGENAEQAVRQCLRQLQVLKTLWIGLFPQNVYANLISLLANAFVDEMIHRVCTVEDIPADTATQISEIYGIIISRLPQIYQEEDEVFTKINKWEKIKEMVNILNGSLKDIEERWCDGAGLLSIHFTPDELRNLIRALFQNTTFRANVLSKIK